ncbi:MAG: hypothetical protein JO370_14900, partial [Paucibacter sp.]|nr:hypothetical protein [Roseateles sp.]
FTLNRTGDSSADSYVFTDANSSGQGISAVSSGSGTMVVSASNANAMTPLNLTLNVSGEAMQVGSVGLTAADSIALTATQIVGGASNQLTAGTVNLSATAGDVGAVAGPAINAAVGALTVNTSGNLNLTVNNSQITGAPTLSSVAITTSHAYGQQFTYAIGGDLSLSATDVNGYWTTLGLTSSSAINFSFSADRGLVVGDANHLGISDVGGTVSLSSSGNYSNYPNYDTTAMGIAQSTVTGATGITANRVSLSAGGYLGYVGTSAAPILLNTPQLLLTSNGNIYAQDSAALTELSLVLSHAQATSGYYAPNTYSIIDGGNLALTLNDYCNNSCNYQWGGTFTQLASLTSSTLEYFTLNERDSFMPLVAGNYSNGNFSTGQINLGAPNSNVTLIAPSIYLNRWNAVTSATTDSTGAAIVNGAAIVANTLNLVSAGEVAASPWHYWSNSQNSLPVQVSNLSVQAGGSIYIQNIGNLYVGNASAGGSLFLQAVASNGPASITAPGAGLMSGSSVALMANYGNLGTSSIPLATNTSNLTLNGGGDMFIANQSELSNLSIVSDHNKPLVGLGTTNTISIADQTLSGGQPLRLGIVDQQLGLGVFQYTLDGLNEPQLQFSFESDSGMVLGALTASTIALTSDTGSIGQLAGAGKVTAAGSVSMTVSQDQSIGATGHPIQINASNLSFTTGGNLYVADPAVITALTLNTLQVDNVNGVPPVYSIDNSGAPVGSQATFNATGDTVNGVLDVNHVVMAPSSSVTITSYSPIAVGSINVPGSGGSISVDTGGSVSQLNGGTGSAADSVSLTAQGGNIGASSAPMLVDTINLATATQNGGGSTYFSVVSTPTRGLANVTVSDSNDGPANALVITDGSVFNLNGGNDGSGVFALLSATASH